MSEYRAAQVYVRDEFAGILRETDEGYSFAYDTAYLSSEDSSAVSLTLPLTEKPYTSKTLFAFFDGLIFAMRLNVDVCGPHQFFSCDQFLDPVCSPAGESGCCKQRRRYS